jgi:hypothetical protein
VHTPVPDPRAAVTATQCLYLRGREWRLGGTVRIVNGSVVAPSLRGTTAGDPFSEDWNAVATVTKRLELVFIADPYDNDNGTIEKSKTSLAAVAAAHPRLREAVVSFDCPRDVLDQLGEMVPRLVVIYDRTMASRLRR